MNNLKNTVKAAVALGALLTLAACKGDGSGGSSPSPSGSLGGLDPASWADVIFKQAVSIADTLPVLNWLV
jgi:hypothetical protein